MAKSAYNKKRLTATGIVPDLHRIPLSPFAAKRRRIAPNCGAKILLFFLIFKKCNKKTSATLVSVADAVICLLIVKGSRAAVNLLRKVNCRERQVKGCRG